MGAMSVWLTEFFLRLQHNVMSDEDLANTWSSDSTADLGLSFWLVVTACISAFVNNVCILIAMADGRDADTIAPALEEKVNGAIMLY
ncbi:jg1695 [Pararge aegeria aegeria]|uniref:Jg1695 protein n=3 Tax=Pararge aegeria TaxID=116150 RepID=A0A8S4SIZ4_9NEOP|nr:jg1695 [Pararge aegeria aegeria]CAH2269161.1 jg1695 [Pararge aegeria aegeria]